MTSRIQRACVLLALCVTVECTNSLSGNAHLYYPNNPFFNQIISNAWENQQAISAQNAFMQQQLQTMFANSQMAFNNNNNNLPGFRPVNHDIGPRPSPPHYHNNPFFQINSDGYIVPNVATKPTDGQQNTTPMPVPIRPPYIDPVDTSGGITDQEMKPAKPSSSTFNYIDGIPVIPLTENEIRR